MSVEIEGEEEGRSQMLIRGYTKEKAGDGRAYLIEILNISALSAYINSPAILNQSLIRALSCRP